MTPSLWVLILCVMTPNGVALKSIPGFRTQQACVTAGKFTANEFGGNAFYSAKYSCVSLADR